MKLTLNQYYYDSKCVQKFSKMALNSKMLKGHKKKKIINIFFQCMD